MFHAVNIREKIARRAIACAEEPQLNFDYDQTDNCEAFANLMNGVAVENLPGAQKANCCIVGICGLIKCFKFYWLCNKSLKKVVAKRLEEATSRGEI